MGGTLRRRPIAWLFALALAAFCLSVLFSSATAQIPPGQQGPAQTPEPPGRPADPGQNPRFPEFQPPPATQVITVWTCSHCGAELGRGDAAPQIERCPKCGARFLSGGSGRDNPVTIPNTDEKARNPYAPSPTSGKDRPPSRYPPAAPGESPSVSDNSSGDAATTFGIVMGIATIIFGLLFLVILAFVLIANARKYQRRRGLRHYENPYSY